MIKKGEERIEKRIRMKQALTTKVGNYKNPEIQLRVPYGKKLVKKCLLLNNQPKIGSYITRDRL
jgi:hypothetical protein